MKKRYTFTGCQQETITEKNIASFTKRILLLFFIFFTCQFSYAQFSCTGFNTTNISYTGAIQTFTVPAGVSELRISLTGASGGQASAATNLAGGGATVYAYVSVVPGDVFRVLMGQKGTNGTYEAGGGGSSAVYKNGVLIMVAGAGGGVDNTGDGGNGLAAINGGDGANDADAGSTGGCVSSVDNGKGGIGGNGGNHGEFAANCPHGGGGGGGLNSAGQGNGNLNAGQPGGRGNINGAAGGMGSLDDAVGINGGWGWSGGGGADDRESGGGAGYSGGGGGPESKNPGGGGSFVAAIGTNGITASGKSSGTGTTTGYNGSGIVCSPSLITLPVILESFTAEKTVEGALLKWAVSGEINIAYYEVQKSTDGVHFSTITVIAASGNSSTPLHYSFTDVALVNTSKVFYRLKMTDADARATYSATRYLDIIQENASLTTYPNPVKERISIVLPQSWKEGNNLILFVNATGQVVMKKTTTSLQSDFKVDMLSSGVYLIKVINSKTNQQLSAKFIK